MKFLNENINHPNWFDIEWSMQNRLKEISKIMHDATWEEITPMIPEPNSEADFSKVPDPHLYSIILLSRCDEKDIAIMEWNRYIGN